MQTQADRPATWTDHGRCRATSGCACPPLPTPSLPSPHSLTSLSPPRDPPLLPPPPHLPFPHTPQLLPEVTCPDAGCPKGWEAAIGHDASSSGEGCAIPIHSHLLHTSTPLPPFFPQLLPEVTCPDAGCPRGKDGKPPLDMLPAAVARDVRMAWISVDRLDGSVPLVAALSNCSHVAASAALSNCSHVSSVSKMSRGGGWEREGVSSGWQCHSGSGRVVPYTGGSAASFPPSPTARTSPASPSAVWTAAVALVTALAHNEGRASVPTMSCCGAMVLAVGGMVLAFIWVVMLTQLIFFLYSSSLVRPHPPVCRRGSSRGTERVSAAVDGSHGAGCGSNGGGCGGSPLRLPCHALPARWWQGRQQVRGLRGKGGWDGAVCELSSVPCAACPMGARVPTGERLGGGEGNWCEVLKGGRGMGMVLPSMSSVPCVACPMVARATTAKGICVQISALLFSVSLLFLLLFSPRRSSQ
ncbi:unnamed protein product [Closterium sp. NIES-54]